MRNRTSGESINLSEQEEQDPLDLFFYLIPDVFWKLLVNETNQYGVEV